jgi:hypothetical protein
MGQFADELIESLQQAATRPAGKEVRGMRVSKIEVPVDSMVVQPGTASADAKSEGRSETD